MARRPSILDLDRDRAQQVAPAPQPARPEPTWPRSKTRAGKKCVGFWIDQVAHIQLHNEARKAGLSVQQAMEEALDMWFATRGAHRLARKA